MDKTFDELDAELGLLSAQTRERELRLRQLEATNRRLQSEAADLLMCVHEIRSLGRESPMPTASGKHEPG